MGPSGPSLCSVVLVPRLQPGTGIPGSSASVEVLPLALSFGHRREAELRRRAFPGWSLGNEDAMHSAG